MTPDASSSQRLAYHDGLSGKRTDRSRGRLDPPRAVILAGGRGTRLAPYTSILPKPLMPIGNRAILQIVVDQLVASGIRDITFCVGYLAHLIRAVFEQEPPENDYTISYVHEDQALGTAGPLRLVDGLTDTFLVMNGDVLTTLDYRELVGHHRGSGNVLTIAAHARTTKLDYGVIHTDGEGAVVRYDEKPEVPTTVSMGVYVLEPEVLEYIPRGQRFDFPQLVERLLRVRRRVGVYVYDGLWFDIGRREDYEEAVVAWANRGRLLLEARSARAAR